VLPDGDPLLGRRIYNQQCLTCHSLEGSPYSNGPLLGNIIGQKAGTMSKYRYSQAIKESKIVWTRENLFKFLRKPQRFIRGNYMDSQVIKVEDRLNIIAYLESQSAWFIGSWNTNYIIYIIYSILMKFKFTIFL